MLRERALLPLTAIVGSVATHGFVTSREAPRKCRSQARRPAQRPDRV